jgi:hypothetical protein
MYLIFEIKMKILLSPAKSISLTDKEDYPLVTLPDFVKEAEVLVKKLKRIKPKELMTLMNISNELAEQNAERYRSWFQPVELSDCTQPCSFIFTGEVYRALDIHTFSESEIHFAQEKIRILSGLYGVLKPLDLIFPYRLEMGTKWSPDTKNKNLYEYWRSKLTKHLKQELLEDEKIINLASSEYSKVLDWKKIPNRVITPVFKEFKNGDYKIVMMYAKHARGAMARYLIQHDIKSADDLKLYNVDGYSFDDKLSSEKEWVFVR